LPVPRCEGVSLTQMLSGPLRIDHPRQGDSLAPGHWQLAKGTAELEFYSGASVILEAPAELEILSEEKGRLHAGKLRAEVPRHAQGFTIATPEIELVDLGTSFGIEVQDGEGTSVHVFDGEVELYEPQGASGSRSGQSLFAGEGRMIESGGGASDIAADEGRFLSPTEFDRVADVRLKQGIQRWWDSAGVLRTDDDLIAYNAFQPEPEMAVSRSLTNWASNNDVRLSGSIIGATWTDGRWPGKGSLEFKRPADRVRISVPNIVESMTLVAWVRIDGFDNRFSSLLLSDGWARPGALHWQIRDDLVAELAVWYGERQDTYNSNAPFVMEPSDFGRWMQLAVIYDGSSGMVTHFRDGSVLGTAMVDATIPLAIGNAEIGNWTPRPRSQREVRNFNGRIDELMIFDRALRPDELLELYHHGKP
ncbi:MAG: LamG-like jellyroll fold domain-containing protein, partial [Verrucomicrobiota bacterium]